MELKWLLSIVTFFMPPPLSEDSLSSPVGQLWRWKVFAGVLVMYVFSGVFLWWFFGGLSLIGLDGAAMANDVRPLVQQVAEIQRQGIEEALQTDQIKICRLTNAAMQSGAQIDILQSALDTAQRDFREHLNKYYLLSGGKQYVIQPCNVLLIAAGK